MEKETKTELDGISVVEKVKTESSYVKFLSKATAGTGLMIWIQTPAFLFCLGWGAFFEPNPNSLINVKNIVEIVEVFTPVLAICVISFGTLKMIKDVGADAAVKMVDAIARAIVAWKSK